MAYRELGRDDLDLTRAAEADADVVGDERREEDVESPLERVLRQRCPGRQVAEDDREALVEGRHEGRVYGGDGHGAERLEGEGQPIVL